MKKNIWNQFWKENQKNNLLKVFFAKKFLSVFFKKNPEIEISDIDWLLALTLKINRSELPICHGITFEIWKKIEKKSKERLQGKPISIIFGSTNFYGLNLKVNSNVLSPRPETEELVSFALKNAKYFSYPSVLDLCTGSGAIAIAIKKNYPTSNVTATDISSKALYIAKKNAFLNDCEIKLIKSDMFSSLPKDKKYHIILSNPPYLKSEELKEISKEVVDYEPSLALDGGKSGLKFYENIALNVSKFLHNDGILIMEIGYKQEEEVKNIFKKHFEIVNCYKDVFNNPRIVICEKLNQRKI
ncbi:MAG: peptide chain release factor N(5)-glutamine methyltransferase [Clostridia bacterium]